MSRLFTCAVVCASLLVGGCGERFSQGHGCGGWLEDAALRAADTTVDPTRERARPAGDRGELEDEEDRRGDGEATLAAGDAALPRSPDGTLALTDDLIERYLVYLRTLAASSGEVPTSPETHAPTPRETHARSVDQEGEVKDATEEATGSGHPDTLLQSVGHQARIHEEALKVSGLSEAALEAVEPIVVDVLSARREAAVLDPRSQRAQLESLREGLGREEQRTLGQMLDELTVLEDNTLSLSAERARWGAINVDVVLRHVESLEAMAPAGATSRADTDGARR